MHPHDIKIEGNMSKFESISGVESCIVAENSDDVELNMYLQKNSDKTIIENFCCIHMAELIIWSFYIRYLPNNKSENCQKNSRIFSESKIGKIARKKLQHFPIG